MMQQRPCVGVQRYTYILIAVSSDPINVKVGEVKKNVTMISGVCTLYKSV